MSGFRNYEDQKRQRYNAAAGLFTLGAAALALPASRKFLTGAALEGLEQLGKRASHVRPSRLQNVAHELEQVLKHASPRAARAALAERSAFRAMENHFVHAGWDPAEAATNARRILHQDNFRRFLLDDTMEWRELLREGSAAQGVWQEWAQRRGAASQAQFRDLLLSARAAVPTLGDVEGSAAVAHVQAQLREAAANHLRSTVSGPRDVPGRLRAGAMGFFGLDDTRLGQLDAQGLWARDLYTLLGTDADQLRVGDMVRFDGRDYDLSGVRILWTQATQWMEDQFQVPLAPGAMGISPFQLFPWTKGKGHKVFDELSDVARDATLRAALDSPTERIGQSVFKIGDDWFAANFLAEQQRNTFRELDLAGEIRSGLYGAMKRRAQQIEAANAAKASGDGKGLGWLGWGRQYEETLWGRIASVGGKFEEGSTWAPRVLERLLSGTPHDEDFARAIAFLTSQGVSPEVRRRTMTAAAGEGADLFQDDLLKGYLRNLDDDQAVVNAFDRFTQLRGLPDDPDSRYHSHQLRELLNQWRASPDGLLGRFSPAADRSVLGYNWVGEIPDRRGLELMRDALFAEAEARFGTAQTGAAERQFLDLVNGWTDLPEGERVDALGYGWGRLLERRADPRLRGHARSLLQDETLGFVRENAEAQSALERFTARHARPWDAHVESDEALLRTHGLLARYGMIGQFNKSLRDGKGFLEASNDALRAGAQGLHSFFTGNQQYATGDTIFLEHFPRKLNEGLSRMGLGLAPEDLGSGRDIFQGLFLKRVVPAWALYESYRYTDHKAEELGLPGPSDGYANVRANLGRLRARHFGERILGMRRDLLPGLEKVIPDRTEEEELRHQEDGWEAVRKGRFWSVGSRGEFWGEKVDYYLPSATRVTRSDWQSAENVDLNTSDYWRHHLLPNPDNPLAPVAKLVDPYWFERKHGLNEQGGAGDRPYLITGELADPNTLHGPLVNMTVGPLLKPRRRLHPEYLPQSLGGTASKEELRSINEAIRRRYDERGVGLVVGEGGPATGGGSAGGVGGDSFFFSPGVLAGGPGARGAIGEIGGTGQLLVKAAPGAQNPDGWEELGQSTNQRPGWATRLSRREVERVNRQMKSGMGGGGAYRPGATGRLASSQAPFTEEDLDLISYQSGMVTGARNLLDVAGLYGWMAENVNPIEQEGIIVQSPSRAQGLNRRFYELEAGGLGGDVSEIGRRFMPRRQRMEEYNPLPNTMPSWLPGPEYMVDFRHGDPYTKIKRGEMRLPGEDYERLHDVTMLRTRASSLGKSEEELMRGMLHLEEPLSDYGEQVTAAGDEIHARLQRRWKRMGVLLGAEFLIDNRELGISGHPDAVLAMADGPALTDIKTVSGKRFQQAKREAFAEHVSQVNFYVHELGMDRGFITYVNRDTLEVHYQNVQYSETLFRRDLAKVRRARERLLGMVESGMISRGDLYSPIDRFEILGDVAPYSDNYAQVRAYLTARNQAGELSEEENERFQATKKRVAKQKRRVDVYPYRFRDMDLHEQSFTVERILDANTLLVEGSDHPLRLAGVKVSNQRIEEVFGPAPEGMTPAEWMWQQYGIREGSRIRAQVEGDPQARVADDTLRTQHAVIFQGGRNVNYDLLQQGAGEEKETDWSDTGVSARFTPGEIAQGALWERFAHLDTLLHTKFLKTRSPLEELERGIVYGKRTGGWSNPVRDYISPTLTSYAAKDPVTAALATGVFSTFFFGKAAGKLSAFKWGAAAGAGMSLLRMGYEAYTEETWKPIRTRRREELEEYWDTLAYVKWRGLAAREETLAKEKEGVDVERMVRGIYEEGQKRDRRRGWLERQKRLIKLGRQEETDALNLDSIQEQLDELARPKGMLKLGPHTAKALYYRDRFRSTLYGIDPENTPFMNVFRAMPKYKRELVEGWINRSSEAERERIFRLLPRAEQRVLGRYLGQSPRDIPDRPTLREYFKDHVLPGQDWEGWRPDVNLEQLRMRALREEGLDPMESGIFELQVDESEHETASVRVPTMRGRSAEIQKTLNELLSGRGLRNVRVTVDVQPHDGEEDDLDIALHLRQHREADLRKALQLHG